MRTICLPWSDISKQLSTPAPWEASKYDLTGPLSLGTQPTSVPSPGTAHPRLHAGGKSGDGGQARPGNQYVHFLLPTVSNSSYTTATRAPHRAVIPTQCQPAQEHELSLYSCVPLKAPPWGQIPLTSCRPPCAGRSHRVSNQLLSYGYRLPL